ncbi:hypothetical protein DTO027B5_5160 [Paecilomyces variotii]|nr:hypothetical protein DTO217A2_2642 [Paecilomyces variotii]KAJ9324507.1 hypothetical protein DTO027B3_4525 [Paecilomyces variotii]KAJ9333072.1 hypothetical protein DTO027B5_5160 [Paecilomyces variotii]KAJ9373584.1 hypothetical protein DTO282E5_1739 [Paecilomyces variotii]KAJ9400324.1 hypothetical protein DTO282F9_2792 [Paecilomyces variotii]
MPTLAAWPDWPEFASSDVRPEDEEEFKEYKRQIIDEYGEENIRKAWLKTCEDLKVITAILSEKGSSVIPELDFNDLQDLSEEKVKELKKIGCFVIRNVIPTAEATAQFENLKQYVSENRDSLKAWPANNPSVYRLFWSPTQQALRAHPNQLLVQRTLNGFWHDASQTTSPDPLTYADAVRIRPPGKPFYGLGPHIDAGSLCRWADAGYRKVYDSIFSGFPERFDAYDLSTRKDADQAAFEGSAHSSVFRAFQGWTALTGTRPREGSLLLYPYVGTVIAYLLLRPFFTPPQEDVMDASKWSFNPDNAWFPGTRKENSQYLSRTSHPHLRLEDCLVHIPEMLPGDTVWWHCDMCHAVEVEHAGKHDASVAYIAATPTTPVNVRYIKSQAENFLAGLPPGDFPGEINETKLKGYLGESGIPNGETGRRAMGFDLLELAEAPAVA